ncbi:hypothetical protein E2C01_044485 [Portunus trituberculatus]|uniref:Uncharacterized protein n=1 Tax=Portunus trituberculatus TaxID=210409 RepID=A0A5B7FYK8_PORTR|nr:hypothetical protein [Portunus trituberculatus]
MLATWAWASLHQEAEAGLGEGCDGVSPTHYLPLSAAAFRDAIIRGIARRIRIPNSTSAASEFLPVVDILVLRKPTSCTTGEAKPGRVT